jgi:hypothetical protein
MNATQTKYTMERVRVLENQKLAALKADYTVKANVLSDADIAKLVRTGKVKIKTNIQRSISHYGFQVSDLYDLSDHHWGQHMREGYEKAEEALKAQAAKVKDEIMLGDNAAALALLREFAGD